MNNNIIIKAKASIIFLVIVILMSIIVFANCGFVEAENTDLVIDLSSNSKFDAYNKYFAYTSGNSLYVAYDNKILSYNDAFNGTCIDLSMTGLNIIVLSKTGSTYYLNYFDFDSDGITLNNKAISLINSSELRLLYSDSNGTQYLFRQFSTDYYVKVFEENKILQNMISKKSMNSSCEFTNFAINNDVLFGVYNGTIYYASSNDILSLDTMDTIPTLSTVSSITIIGNKLYANTNTGIYQVDLSTYEATKSCDTPNSTGKIVGVSIDENNYIMAYGTNAIIQYSISGTSLQYLNKFDNSAYVHPTEMNILKVAQVKSTANVYSSPKNLQINTTVNIDDYVLVLATKTDTDNGDYYYIVTNTNQVGYISTSTSLTYIDANSDINSIPIGLYAQGLHAKTTIYQYPYSSSSAIEEVSIQEQLVVIDNVAEVDNVQVWDYYKVSYVKDSEIITGYVKVTDVSPYTSLKAPIVLKSVKITTSSIGEVVYLYALPSDTSTQIAAVTDGTELNLAEEYNKDSTWTKVTYNGEYVYVLTSQIQQSGLTTLQITLIVISIIVVIATIVMIIILRYRRKFGY